MAEIVRDMVAVVKAMSDVERALLRSVRLDKAAWTVWHRVVADRTLGDAHPRFRRPYNHRRVLGFVEGFDALAGYRNEDELEGVIVEAMRQVKLRMLEEVS